MRSVKVQIIALGFLLVCFTTAGAMLIWQDPSEGRQTNFTLWLLGLPLGVFGGFALGFIIRGRKDLQISHNQEPVQYIVVGCVATRFIFGECLKGNERCHGMGQIEIQPKFTDKKARTCRSRFRPVNLPYLDENQLREN